jgi:hypothetical protein
MYSRAFWTNFRLIEHCEKYIERIEKGEAEIERQNLVEKVIRLKFEQLQSQGPWPTHLPSLFAQPS